MVPLGKVFRDGTENHSLKPGSGGNLAAVLAHKAVQAEPPIPLLFQLLVVPVTDNTASTSGVPYKSWAENANTVQLTPGRMLWFRDNYLPNEKDIIRSQVLYALEELVYPKEKLRINLVYNTPKPIEPLESELALLPEQFKNLRVIKVPGSKSKADNLNYFFNLESDADVIGIFDSDHCPHPHNPRCHADVLPGRKHIHVRYVCGPYPSAVMHERHTSHCASQVSDLTILQSQSRASPSFAGWS